MPSAPSLSPLTDPPLVRAATGEDASAVAGIYAHHVLTGTGTFEITPPDTAEMDRRMARVLGNGWPWLVAERHGACVGFAYAAQYRDREAYARTCEGSVYVAGDAQGQGIGRALLQALLPAARAAGFLQMVAVIGDSGNLASLALHRALGFQEAGRLRDVGLKFGRTLDVVLMQRTLGD
ncbi:MAG: GNAT family N-acetyltransferase [Thermaurantiacus sp.]